MPLQGKKLPKAAPPAPGWLPLQENQLIVAVNGSIVT
jgi:hypothetical protein